MSWMAACCLACSVWNVWDISKHFGFQTWPSSCVQYLLFSLTRINLLTKYSLFLKPRQCLCPLGIDFCSKWSQQTSIRHFSNTTDMPHMAMNPSTFEPFRWNRVYICCLEKSAFSILLCPQKRTFVWLFARRVVLRRQLVGLNIQDKQKYISIRLPVSQPAALQREAGREADILFLCHCYAAWRAIPWQYNLSTFTPTDASWAQWGMQNHRKFIYCPH